GSSSRIPRRPRAQRAFRARCRRFCSSHGVSSVQTFPRRTCSRRARGARIVWNCTRVAPARARGARVRKGRCLALFCLVRARCARGGAGSRGSWAEGSAWTPMERGRAAALAELRALGRHLPASGGSTFTTVRGHDSVVACCQVPTKAALSRGELQLELAIARLCERSRSSPSLPPLRAVVNRGEP